MAWPMRAEVWYSGRINYNNARKTSPFSRQTLGQLALDCRGVRTRLVALVGKALEIGRPIKLSNYSC